MERETQEDPEQEEKKKKRRTEVEEIQKERVTDEEMLKRITEGLLRVEDEDI